MTDLIVRRRIRATPEALFAAWSRPELLRTWWGPSDVICDGAEIDLRVGGRYRISNRYADGRVVWIVGVFEVVAPPNELVFTWRLEPGSSRTERVTIRLEAQDSATEVTVVHERIDDAAAREGHEQGWHGCLDGLAAFVAGT